MAFEGVRCGGAQCRRSCPLRCLAVPLLIFLEPVLGGGIRNRRNLEWRNWAQQKCAKFCRGILRTEVIFLGVSFGALGMHSPLVPTQLLYRDPLVFVHDDWSIVSMRVQHHMPLASNSKQPTFAVYVCSHTTIGECCTKFRSGFLKFVPNFHRTEFCHSKLCTFRPPPPLYLTCVLDMHSKGMSYPPPPLQGAQPMPSHCLH